MGAVQNEAVNLGVTQDISLQDASLDIWQTKYCLKSKQGENIDLCVEDSFDRVALTLSKIESGKTLQKHWYKKICMGPKTGSNTSWSRYFKCGRTRVQASNINH